MKKLYSVTKKHSQKSSACLFVFFYLQVSEGVEEEAQREPGLVE